MSEVTQKYPLEEHEPRLSIKEPHPRHDTQGDVEENERLRRERDMLKQAVAIFFKDPNKYLDS